MNTAKKGIRQIAKICALKGVKYAVISPGSRNAPLITAFTNEKSIQCVSIVDERCAGFFALGIAQQERTPVVLLCTSGSAVLNYAPAIAEAFYQKIPLIVITADRPHEWIDQGENQSIVQSNIYQNYIKKSVELPVETTMDKDQWYSDRLINEALNNAMYPEFGPVHINVPLREPLYDLIEEDENEVLPKIIEYTSSLKSSKLSQLESLQHEWHTATKKLIVVGAHASSDELNSILAKITHDGSTIILSESISNLAIDNTKHISMMDACVEYITQNNKTALNPDILITIGGGIVSKKLKFYLRKQQITHWHISPSGDHWDTFQNLSKVIEQDAVQFLEALYETPVNKSSTYQKDWLAIQDNMNVLHHQYLSSLSFCDFKVFEYLIENLPKNSNIHFGNSTPIRYANLFSSNENKQQSINANRGVSGIDGVTSTASGAAFSHPDKITFCITGDIAFLYDSNALWNSQLPKNLKIIVINNGGGNIFRIIPGPTQIDKFEHFIETKHEVKFKQLSEAFDVAFLSCDTMDSLQEKFTELLQLNNRAAVLEVKTDASYSSDALKNYFQYLIKNYEQN